MSGSITLAVVSLRAISRTSPEALGALTRAVAGKGERSADLLAHMGWGDFLWSREGVEGLDPTRTIAARSK